MRENSASMPPAPLAPLYDLLGPDLHPIAGASVSAEIPMAEDLVNRLIAERLRAAEGPVAAVRLRLRADRRVDAFVTLRAPAFLPEVRAEIDIVGQPRLPDRPVLTLRWALPGLGLLARLASPVVALANALPPGIDLRGDRIDVRLDVLLASQGLADLVRYLTRVEVDTRPGAVVVRLGAHVPAGEGVSPPGAA
jgi:hypothetical protein